LGEGLFPQNEKTATTTAQPQSLKKPEEAMVALRVVVERSLSLSRERE
jgi:hypothetical protein